MGSYKMCRKTTSKSEQNPISVTLRESLKPETDDRNDQLAEQKSRFIPVGKNGRSEITGIPTCPSIDTHFVCPKSNPCRCRGECTISGTKIFRKLSTTDSVKAEMGKKIEHMRKESYELEQLIQKLRNEAQECDSEFKLKEQQLQILNAQRQRITDRLKEAELQINKLITIKTSIEKERKDNQSLETQIKYIETCQNCIKIELAGRYKILERMNEEKKSIERSNFKLKLENDVFRSKLEDYKQISYSTMNEFKLLENMLNEYDRLKCNGLECCDKMRNSRY